ncbi:hypothetical protein HT031_003494 [Scenedesmus sp. PABB004]|nr:hypothetical protein HT031_003494 [Scenedesmus sp. PABB004]
MVWEREAEFKALLAKCAKKASKSALDGLAAIAVEDHATCYKAAPALMERALRHAPPGLARLHVMYGVGKVLRGARRALKARSKYGERFGPLLPGMFEALGEGLPADEGPALAKLLASWRAEGVLTGAQVDACEAKLPAELRGAAGGGGGEHHQRRGARTPTPPAAGALGYVQAGALTPAKRPADGPAEGERAAAAGAGADGGRDYDPFAADALRGGAAPPAPQPAAAAGAPAAPGTAVPSDPRARFGLPAAAAAARSTPPPPPAAVAVAAVAAGAPAAAVVPPPWHGGVQAHQVQAQQGQQVQQPQQPQQAGWPLYAQQHPAAQWPVGVPQSQSQQQAQQPPPQQQGGLAFAHAQPQPPPPPPAAPGLPLFGLMPQLQQGGAALPGLDDSPTHGGRASRLRFGRNLKMPPPPQPAGTSPSSEAAPGAAGSASGSPAPGAAQPRPAPPQLPAWGPLPPGLGPVAAPAPAPPAGAAPGGGSAAPAGRRSRWDAAAAPAPAAPTAQLPNGQHVPPPPPPHAEGVPGGALARVYHESPISSMHTPASAGTGGAGAAGQEAVSSALPPHPGGAPPPPSAPPSGSSSALEVAVAAARSPPLNGHAGPRHPAAVASPPGGAGAAAAAGGAGGAGGGEDDPMGALELADLVALPGEGDDIYAIFSDT